MALYHLFLFPSSLFVPNFSAAGREISYHGKGAIKEIPGYTENAFDRDEVFRGLIEGKSEKKA